MGAPVDRWARRFRARVDASARGRERTPTALHLRELHTTLFLAWLCLGTACLLAVAAVVAGVPWWTPAVLAMAAASFARAHRVARRPGGPPS
ncbi:hypothetical protein [Klenkia sp. PcliD-1-E]|uniref:hypothetical protein n=1 Tax=Klenkia sp. PcliD-1-E TaxID=2954492 RepID=UPI002097B71D|nr:hypothetical protein [Klenkia sp. PcliD-1-E]MCO7220711.1 hypothetical protein [Klenkia sp. PcliD-1-E]